MWWNGVGQNKETDKAHDEYCDEEGFQLAIEKFNRDGREGREALGMGYCSIDTWNGLELKLDWSRNNSSYFQ